MMSQLRLIGLVVALAAILGAWGMLVYWKREAGVQRARADAAEASAKLATNTIQITERFHTTTRVVTQKAEESAHAVEAIPSDDVPDDVLSAWRGGLRNVAAASNDPGSAEPPR